MNVDLIKIPRSLAIEKLREYVPGARKSDPELAAIRRAYQYAAEGRAVIQLSTAIRQAPVDEAGRPRLAIARSDRRQVRMNWPQGRNTIEFRTDSTRTGRIGRDMIIRIDMERPAPKFVERRQWGDSYPDLVGQSIVPMVPPGVRRQLPHKDLSRLFTLFEVESWVNVPPIDPYILHHIGGDLYAVMGEWDLTEIERAVMAQFRGA
jgi:hypothetical protein